MGSCCCCYRSINLRRGCVLKRVQSHPCGIYRHPSRKRLIRWRVSAQSEHRQLYPCAASLSLSLLCVYSSLHPGLLSLFPARLAVVTAQASQECLQMFFFSMTQLATYVHMYMYDPIGYVERGREYSSRNSWWASPPFVHAFSKNCCANVFLLLQSQYTGTHIKHGDICVSVPFVQLCRADFPWSSGRYPRPVRAITHTSPLGLRSHAHCPCRLLADVSELLSSVPYF